MDIEKLNKIKQFRKEGKTYRDIAKIFGVTRQRINQIYSDGKYNSQCKYVSLVCPICKKSFEIQPSLANKKHCSTQCWETSRYKTPEELIIIKEKRKKSRREYSKIYYKIYYAKLKKDKTRWAIHKTLVKIYNEKYMRDLKKDEKQYAIFKQKNHEYYIKNKKTWNK